MEKRKWYFSPAAVILAILLAGPFAIPLVWAHPELKPRTKWLIVILILVLTVWMCMLTADIFKQTLKSLQDLQKTLEM